MKKTKVQKKVNVTTNKFPGYVLVEMIMSDEAWYIVRNTPGVTGFIGSSGKGAKPTPLQPYEVDKILIVEPHETEALEIVEGKDYCTLVTCTPYGVNSHRLLVRGHRIENPLNSGEMFITAEAIQIEPLIVAAVIAIPIFVLLTVIVLLWSKKSHKR